MVEIIFESHSTTFDNEAHISSGWNDVELSPLGIRQSHELGQRYKDATFDAIFCSDLQRSYKTAELAFGDRFPIIQDKRLRECDYGDLTQHPADEVTPEKPKRIKEPFPNGESYEQAAERMKSFLDELAEKYDGKKVMIIGHRATQYGLEYVVHAKTLEEIIPAPWSWQPGWTYRLWQIPQGYSYKSHVFSIHLGLTGLAEKFELLGKNWVIKKEFHVSLLITRYTTPTLMERDNLSEEQAEEKIRKTVVSALGKTSPKLGELPGEVRYVHRDTHETLIFMINVPGLKEFYDSVNEQLGLSLEVPPTHITTYITAASRGIAVVNSQELAEDTRLLTDSEMEEMTQLARFDQIAIIGE